MSRRCARECVAWPREGAAVDVADALLGRLWPVTFMVGAFDGDEVRSVRGDEHDRVLQHLRERPVLP